MDACVHLRRSRSNIVGGKVNTTSLHDGDGAYEVDWASLDALIDEGVDLWGNLPRTHSAAIARAKHLCARQS